MTRRVRLQLGLAALVVIGAYLLVCTGHLPSFGSTFHPYRTLSVQAALARNTANAVSSVNFDQRGLDTLIEETILLGSVLAAAALLRPMPGEQERRIPEVGRILPSSRFVGFAVLPLTLVIGIDVVAHGQVSPGGGFQGGAIIATGIHLLYVAGSFRAVEGIRPLTIYRLVESVTAGAFAVLGIAGLVATGSFLTNFIATGSFGAVFSAGTVAVLNGIVGVEVAAGLIVLIAHFLDQEILIRSTGDDSGEDSS